jgi:hypothetical protein
MIEDLVIGANVNAKIDSNIVKTSIIFFIFLQFSLLAPLRSCVQHFDFVESSSMRSRTNLGGLAFRRQSRKLTYISTKVGGSSIQRAAGSENDKMIT